MIDIILPGQFLKPDQAIRSPNGLYRLIYQLDANLVYYGPGVAKSIFKGMVGKPLGRFDMQGDGNGVLNGPDGLPQKQSNGEDAATHSSSDRAWMQIKDNGELVIIGTSGQTVWKFGVVIPPPVPGSMTYEQAVVLVNNAYKELLTWSGRPDGKPDPFGLNYYTSRLMDGRMTDATMRDDIKASAEYKSAHPPIPVPGAKRKGPVRLLGQAYADDGGPWLGFGTTYFPALWMEKFDAARLELNLKWMSDNSIDYIRILSMVGGGSWEDRTVNPNWPDYWQVVDALISRVKRHGMRIQPTLFATAEESMPNMSDRRSWVDKWCTRMNRELDMFVVTECANEYWQNGLDLDQLCELTLRMKNQTSVLVMASAPGGGSMPEGTLEDWSKDFEAGKINQAEVDRRIVVREEWRRLAEVCDMMGPHFDRDISGTCGQDRPVRQPWEMLFAPKDVGVKGYQNNEPIGPESSVNTEGDPRRLGMSAATTWLTQGAGYVLHTGAGVRAGGAADLARGRSANIWEVAQISAIVGEINRIRKVLPVSLPNCQAHNANGNYPNRVFNVNSDSLCRCYHSTSVDGTVVALPHGIVGSKAVLTIRRPCEIEGRRMFPGEIYEVPAPSAVLVGKLI